MKLFLLLLLFCSTYNFTYGQTFPNPASLSTGQGSVNSLDPIWLVSDWYPNNPPNPMGISYTPALINNNCAPGAWVTPSDLTYPINNGNWITGTNTPCNNNTNDGYIYFRLPLNLPSTCNGNNIAINGNYTLFLSGYVDNMISDVFVNGVSQVINGGGYIPGGQLNMALSGPWVGGLNYIDIQVYNTPNGGTDNPYGLLMVADYVANLNSDLDNDGIVDLNDICPCQSGGLPDGCCTAATTPTGPSTQSFCNPSFISDLVATGTLIKWYDAPTNGNLLPNTTPLVNGTIYYASQTVSGCESSTRLAVTVSLNIITSPILSSPQSFCNSAMISDLAVSNNTIQWYTSAVGGNPISLNSELNDGITYFASQILNGCESPTRSSVLVNIITPLTPIGNSSQLFCDSGNISDINVTSLNIQWYDNVIGGNLLPVNTPLVNGATYYAAHIESGCESLQKLSVTVTVNPRVTPTFVPVSPICYGDTIAELPSESIEGIFGLWSPSINNTLTTNYTFTPESGTCTNSATMTILVSAIPPGNQPDPLYFCDSNNDGFGSFDLTQVIPSVIGQNDMDVSFHETVTDAENDLTYIPNPSNYYNISVNHQTIYIRVESTDQSVFVSGTGSYLGGVFSSFPPGLQINPSDGTISPTNSTPGTYTITYTTPSSPNCPSTTSTTLVTISELPTASISYNDLPFCTSSTFQPVNLVGSGGFFSSTSGVSLDTITGVINPSLSIPGNYTITYTIPASGGCEEVKSSTQIIINDSPKAHISYSNSSFCVSINQPQTPTLTGFNSSSASYLGGVYNAGIGLSIDSVTGAIIPSTSIAGIYTVTYSTNIDPANPNCPPVIATTQVTINPLPTASISYSTPFCSTDISKNVNLVGSGGAFSSSSGLSIDAVSGTIFPSLSIPGTYIVSYIIPASNGCNAVTSTTSVTITPAPSSNISYSNSPFCKSINTPQIPIVLGSLGGVFSTSAGLSIDLSSGAITPALSTIGNYSVLYTIPSSGGCPAYTTSTVVSVNSIIAPIVNCGVSDNNSVSFTWDAIQGVDNYLVSYQINSGTNINVGQIGNVQFYSVIGLNPLDVVTITVTPIAIDPNNSCYTSSSGTCTATNCAPSSATINYPASPFCSTSTMEPVTISGNSTGTFSSTPGLVIDAITGSINPSMSNMGQYTVTYTIPTGVNCSAYVTTATVVINSGPIATINYLNPIFCKSLLNLQPPVLIGSTGGTFSSTTGLMIDTITGEILPNGSVVGNYTVNYTIPAIGGCQAVVASTQVEIIDSPMATISYPSPICSNDTTPKLVTLTGTSGGIFTSSPGLTIDSNTGTITPNTSTPGTYTITYTIPANNGCDEVISNASVVINDTLSSPIITCGTSTLNSVTFEWDSIIAADNYLVTYQVGSTINNIGSVGTNLNYTITNLNPGDLVTITVTPSNSSNNISCLEAASFTCSSLNCSINEIQITPSVITTNSVQFNWNPIQNATAYWLIYQVNGNINSIGNINSTNYTISNLNPGDVVNITISASMDGVNYFCQSQGNAIIPSCNPSSSSISYSSTYYCKSAPIICHKILPLELIINPTPVATEPADYHVCDDNNDGFASFNLASISPEVLGTINPITNSISYYTSLLDAQTNSNPILNLIGFVNQTITTQTIWIRVEIIATGCYDIVTLQLFVDPLPNAIQPNYPSYTLCDYNSPLGYETFDLGSKISDILLGQNGVKVGFYFSQGDAIADVNELPLFYINSTIYVQTLWIRLENVNTGCFVLSTIDIRVEPLPSPIIPDEPYTVCDDNQDGFSSFDLNTLTTDILQGANYTITYHETFVDATLGNNALSSPYYNLNPFIQYIYVSAVDNVNSCRNVIAVELNVKPQPKIPISIPSLVQCDEDNNPQDSTMIFNLTQNTSNVLSVQDSAPSNYTVTYYTSQYNAINGLAPIIQTTYYTGTNNEIIWVRVENNDSHCFAIGSFVLIVNSPLHLTNPSPLSLCDYDANSNNLYTIFDLTVKDNEITQGQSNVSVTYYPTYPITSLSIPISNPTTYTNISPAVQTLGVMVTNSLGCKSYTTLDVRVLPIPTPRTNPPSLIAKCDVTNSGDLLEFFDLTVNSSYIINGDPNLTLHYYSNQADAIANVSEITTPTSALVGNNVWIRVENNRIDSFGQNCYVLVEQPLAVYPLPTVNSIPFIQNCDDDSDGFSVFDLTSTKSAILGAYQLSSNYTFSYYNSATDAQFENNAIVNPNSYTNISNPQTIYIRVVNNITGCVNYTGQFTLVVNPKPYAISPPPFNICDDINANDGFYPLNLSIYIPGIINGQTNVSTSFYESQLNALNGNNAISNLTNYQAYSHSLWIRVENNNTGCYVITPFNIIVETLAIPIITSPSDTICVEWGTENLLSGLTLNSGISNTNYNFTWYLNNSIIPSATQNIYHINSAAPGDYTVVATSKNPPLLGCVSDVSNTFSVIQSGPPKILTPSYTVSNAFQENQTITINAIGYGLYEYSIDEGPFQLNNVFQNVPLGIHFITIRDVKGNTSCGEVIIQSVQIIDYPHYFTPNGDGYHETWNVIGLENQLNARLYIFDRYGKLLKQLSTAGLGWDGTYNEKLMPSTDYWFRVEFIDNNLEWKEFKSHFTLKR